MTPVWHHEQRRTAPVGGVKSDAGLMIGYSGILVVVQAITMVTGTSLLGGSRSSLVRRGMA